MAQVLIQCRLRYVLGVWKPVAASGCQWLLTLHPQPDSVCAAHAMCRSCVLQVGEFAELAYDVRRQLSRMENLVDKYGSIPQSRLAAMSRPASRGPGLLLINPAAVQPVAEGGTLRRGRSQSVVAATSAKDIAKAVALAGGGGPGEGGGRTMPSSQRPFLQLSTSAGAIGARHNVAKRSGPSKRLPPVTAPAITAAAHEAGAAPQRLSTPEMDRLRGQLQAHHEKLSQQLTRMSELLRRF